MKYRLVKFRNGGSYSIQDDPGNILYYFISGALSDMLQLKADQFPEFMRQFDPLGDGYYVYSAASASRVTYAPRADDPEPQADDEWVVQDETVIPAVSVMISGAELRDLFRQVIEGLTPFHPELRAVYGH
ncbi:hypothetical protein [Deinococcus sp. UR1]|jgi:hypothetical protein|uniref:hypothetical protein n=1 Tax=Deinococcus sp. UR1 TaxID=1704277 RepID=UPI0006DC18B7|nr:hypothetical protein [Deinococcus sp. UR1]PIG98728.1 hypothetical protein AMD26_007955 [Deinococcus sp. UR1]